MNEHELSLVRSLVARMLVPSSALFAALTNMKTALEADDLGAAADHARGVLAAIAELNEELRCAADISNEYGSLQ